MRRKIIWIAAVVIIVFSALFAYLLINADTLIAHYKPQLENRVSAALGTRATFDEVSLRVFPRVGLEASGVSLSGEGVKDDEISFERIVFNAELLPLIRGQLIVRDISLYRPFLTVLQTEDGMRVGGLPDRQRRADREARARIAGAPDEPHTPGRQPGAVRPLNFQIDKFRVRDATIRVRSIDQSEEGQSTMFEIVSLNVDSLLETRADDIFLPRLSAEGRIRDRGRLSLELRDSSFSPDTGELNVPTAELQFPGARASLGLNYNINENTGRFTAEPASYTLRDETLSMLLAATINGDNIVLQQSNLDAFGGRANLKGEVKLGEYTSFSTDFSADAIRAERIIAALGRATTVTVSGPLSARAELNGIWKDEKTLKQSLNGEGEFTLGQGEISGLNIAERVLNSIGGLPYLSEALLTRVPPEFREVLQQDRTTVRHMTADFLVRDSIVRIHSIDLQSDLMNLNGEGRYALEGEVDIRAVVTFSDSLSAALADRVRELRHALDEDGRLSVPVRFQGPADQLQVIPDTRKLAESAVGRAIEEGARRLLDRATRSRGEENGGQETEGKSGDPLRELGKRLGL